VSLSSQFAPGELRSILIAWIVLSFAISISYIEGLFSGRGGVTDIAAAFIATATAFILHEMGHKFVAIERGYVAHFQIWIWGIALTLLTAVAFQGAFIFGAPGAVYIAPAAATGGYYGYSNYTSSNGRVSNPKKDELMISLAGPGVNLAFALFFLLVLFITPLGSFVWTVASYGVGLNVGLGSFNMLPVPPIDGYKIFKSNIVAGLLVALPLWALFLIFFLNL
jgi:Zn-dependent protease